MRTLDEHFRIYQYLLKRDHAPLPHRHYDNTVVEQAISNRISFLNAKSDALYSLDIFFVLLYEGWQRTSVSQGKLLHLVSRPQSALLELLSRDRVLTLVEDDLVRAREMLANKAASFVIQLKDTVGIELLDKYGDFAFFRRLLNFAPYKLHTRLKYDVHLDYFACDATLECYRDHLRIDGYFVQVLTLKEPPAQTFAHVLGALEEIPSNYAIVNEWKRESNLTARKEINSKRRHFHNSKASLTNYLGDRPLNPQEMLIDDGAAGLAAAITQRPDLFAAAILFGPLCDMLRFHLFPGGRMVGIDEFGSPEIPEERQWLEQYSPYHRVRTGIAYPAVLIISGDADTRCDPMHSRKMVARLREVTTSGRPILLDYHPQRGHAALLPVNDRIETLANQFCFLFSEMGLSLNSAGIIADCNRI
jgi:hypothetical protein